VSEQPQAFDPYKVRVAYGQAQGLAMAVGSRKGISAYQAEVQRVVEEALEPANDMDELKDRLAYLLYGTALFGLLGAELAQLPAEGERPMEEVLSLMGDALTRWLDEHTLGA
jgi:hypothetical protein